MKTIFKNLVRAILVMLYFITLNFAYTRMNLERLIGDIKVFSGVFLVLGLLALEKSYKEEKGSTAITAIELMALSMHSLSIMNVITMMKYDFRTYLLTSSYIIAIYYVFKAIVIYTMQKRKELKELSDISEIVKEDEPIKKEAKKRRPAKAKKAKAIKEESKKEVKKND